MPQGHRVEAATLEAPVLGRLEEATTASREPERVSVEMERFFTLSTDMFSVVSHEGTFRRVNPSWEAVLGYVPSDLIGRPFLDLVHPDDHDATVREFVRASTEGAVVQHFQNRYRHKDGSYRWLDWASRFVSGDQAHYSVARDITVSKGIADAAEQRRVQAGADALQDSEARTRAMIDSALDGVIAMDDMGIVRDFNAAAEAMFGRSRIDAIGKPMADLVIPSALRASHQHSLERFRQNGEAHILGVRQELQAMRADGSEFPIELTVTHARVGGASLFTGFVRDLSEHKRLEQQFELKARDLRQLIERRDKVSASLARITSDGSPETIGRSVCDEISRTLDLELVTVVEVVGVSRTARLVPLAIAADGTTAAIPIQVGQPIPLSRSTHVVARARSGPWVSDLAAVETTPFLQGWRDLGLRYAAYLPIGESGDPLAVLTVVTRRGDVGSLTQLLPDLREYAVMAAGYLKPALMGRRATGVVRDALDQVIRHGAFHPAFQPIVTLGGRQIVGYEALTRFDDRRAPDIVFAEAASVGLGIDLEVATLRAAILAAATLPAGTMLSLNVSPDLILSGSLAAALPARREQLVLEVTEHSAINDYGAIRAAVGALGPLRLAVDDAGAGFASLRHILELQPQFVKLDMSLVRGIEGDTARQGLIAGMVHFATHSDRTIIAEGIETQAELDTLRSLGVELGQGYLLGRPARLKRVPGRMRVPGDTPVYGSARTMPPSIGTIAPVT